MNLSVTIVVDNQTASAGLLAEHGLAAWVATEHGAVLFDTGQSGDVLLHNASALGVDWSALWAVAISHGHYDHTGGLPMVMQQRPTVPIFMHPEAMVARYRECEGAPMKPIGMTREACDCIWKRERAVRWTTAPTRILDGIHLTGPVPRGNDVEDVGGRFFLDPQGRTPDPVTDDQALWFECDRGIVIVLGCAHAGVVNTLDAVARIAGTRRIHALIGGMHLLTASEERLHFTLAAIRGYGVAFVAPCHCTGSGAMAWLAGQLGPICRPCAAGQTFTFRTTA